MTPRSSAYDAASLAQACPNTTSQQLCRLRAPSENARPLGRSATAAAQRVIQRELSVHQAQRNDADFVDTDVARKLCTKHGPAIHEVCWRQRDDREAATRHPSLDLADERCTKRQIIDEQQTLRRQIERGKQISTHEVNIRGGIDEEQVKCRYCRVLRRGVRILDNHVSFWAQADQQCIARRRPSEPTTGGDWCVPTYVPPRPSGDLALG